MTQPQTWQESLNPQLAQRLIRPLVQPGVINTQIAREIIERSQRFTNRLPLLANRHWASVTSVQSGQTPIVYAQPQPPVTPTDTRQQSPDSPGLETGNLPVIQAKLASNPTKAPDKSGRLASPNNIVYAQPQPPVTPTDTRQQSPDSLRLETGNLPVVQAKLASNAQSAGVPHQAANNSPTEPSRYPITKRGNREQGTGNSSFFTVPSFSLDFPQQQVTSSHLESGGFHAESKSSPETLPVPRSLFPVPYSPLGQDVERNHYSQVVVVPERTEAPVPPTPLVFSKMTTDVGRPSPSRTTKDENPSSPVPRSLFPVPYFQVRPEANSTKQAATDSNQTRQRMPSAGGQGGFSTEGLRAQNYPEAIARPSPTGKPVPVTQVDVEAIANQVERKLMRRLVVESERRGKKRWP